ATDNGGAIDNDTVQVTVNAAINKAPVANAGADTSITLPVNSTTLNGSATDADGSIASYKWTKILGPSSGTIATPSAASTGLYNLVQGVYLFQFTATDNGGAIDNDTVQVTVNAAINIAPVANAGPDINIYLPQNFGYLMGSGTDVDGVIISYHWRVISAPAPFTLENQDSSTARLINLQQGVYEVELKVTDNQNKEGLDTVKVFVGSSRIDVSFELLNVYPNPVRDVLNIKINTKDPGQTALITMFNLNGAQVYFKQIKITGMTWVETVDVSNFNKGAFLVQINIGSEKSVVKKIVKL
ncbi:MAG: T9SS type A sorting domain-containing protein, partial [Ferruginibacter sp.]|nr:T9SS type A sorting domain-containing protein [Ferruginibacter sp.]